MNYKWLYRGKILEQSIQSPEKNNFMLIRLLASIMVVEGHTYLIEKGANPHTFEKYIFSFLGVPAFFFISGLLVSQSLEASSSWKNFVWKRILRIYPAAILCVLFAALLIGPLVTTYSLRDYFSDRLFYLYLTTCSLIHIKYKLPGVFEHSFSGTSSVNSSLWTIALELKLYFGLLVLWLLRIPGKKYFLIFLIIANLLIGFVFPNQSLELITKIKGQEFNLFPYLSYVTLFLIGVVCYLFKNVITVRVYWIFIIFAAFLLSLYFHCFKMTAFIILPAFILYAATQGVRWLKIITPTADLSYGIYLFAFPIQQLIANYFHPASPFNMFLLSILFVIPFAAFSWYLIEKKALKLKHLVN